MTQPTAQPPQAEPPRRCRNFAACRREALHLLSSAIKLITLVVLLAWLVGIPGRWLTPYLRPHTTPWQITCSRVTMNPLRGFIVHAVEMNQPGATAAPSVSATTLIVSPDYSALLNGKIRIATIHAHGASANFPFNATGSNEPPSTLTFTGIQAAVTFSPDESILIRLLAHSGIGTDLTLDGTILPPPPRSDQPETPPPEPSLILLDDLLQRAQNLPPWIQRLYSRARQADFQNDPKAHIAFTINRAQPDAHHATITWQTDTFTFREALFTGARLEATYTNRQVVISEASLRIDGHQLLITGSYDLTNDLFTARVYGDVPPDRVALLLPAQSRAPIDRLGLQWQGTLHAEGWVGPCALAEIPQHWSTWITLEAGTLNELPVQRAFANIKRTPEALMLRDGLIQGGKGKGQGTLRFSHTTDYLTRQTRGTLELDLELKQMDALLPRGLRRVASWFEITDQPIQFTGTYASPLDDLDQLLVKGNITGRHFTFRTAPVVQAQVGLTYSNNHVHLEPFTITCATGGITGMLHLDLTDDLYSLDLDVTANPHHVAPMAGTNFARYFKPYRFTDDIRIHAHGLVDLATDQQTDLAITASGRKIGYWKLTADHLAMEARRLPGQLLITNITATVGRGSITGAVTVTHQPDIDLFEGTLTATNITLESIATLLNPGGSNRYEGILRGQVTLTGTVPDTDAWENLNGTGHLSVENGRLLIIPVFGGLSTLLGKIYPGLGFSEQNLAEASLRFNAGKIRTRDLKITGNIVSLAGRGTLNWSGQLDGDVQVHPFRDGSLASAVRILTLPLSKLLEFSVTGPVTNPVWNAVNIPLL